VAKEPLLDNLFAGGENDSSVLSEVDTS